MLPPIRTLSIGARLLGIIVSITIMLSTAISYAQVAVTPPELEDVGVAEHLGAQVPLDVPFRDHTGKQVKLSDYFGKKRPILLTLAYHSCPVLCSMVLNATVEALRKNAWSVGKDFDVITLSIDPRETLERTAEKRASILTMYGRPDAERGWHFLIGDDANIHQITSAIGYQYHYDTEQAQYAHPAVVLLLTPTGRVARYLYGIEYDPQDIRLGLLEASAGKTISTIEQIILYCYHYDPKGKKYAIAAMRVMQIGGILTALALGAFLGLMWVKERRAEASNDVLPSDARASSAVR